MTAFPIIAPEASGIEMDCARLGGKGDLNLTFMELSFRTN